MFRNRVVQPANLRKKTETDKMDTAGGGTGRWRIGYKKPEGTPSVGVPSGYGEVDISSDQKSFVGLGLMQRPVARSLVSPYLTIFLVSGS